MLLLASCGRFKKGADTDAGPGEQAASSAQAPAATSPADPEREKDLQRYCERKCQRECDDELHERPAYLDTKKAAIAAAPFQVSVERTWLKSSCHRGDDPQKRSDADGITAVVEGKLTYTGDDELFRAAPAGAMFLRVGTERNAHVQVAEKSYSMWGGRRDISRFTRPVRGADPWVKGQVRDFHWESQPLDPGFCDLVPQEASVLLEVHASGLRTGTARHPVKLVPLTWQEIAGIAVRQKVTVRKQRGADLVDEPAEVLYSRLDRVLASFATGKVEWINHGSILQTADFTQGPAVTFPAEAKTPQWTVKINAVSRVKEANGFRAVGEDQFLTVVELELVHTASAGEDGREPKPVKVRAFSFQLETAPGTWQRPNPKATDLAPDFDIAAGSKATGKLAFPSQRFERPFRLEVRTPDRSTVLIDVFSYSISPETWIPSP
jgi:hypothetical protein